MDSLARAFGLPASGRQFPGPLEATVIRVSAGVLYVRVLEDLEVAVRWSGADLLHLPPVGSGCLIAFVDGDLSRGWAVAFDGWRP